jgi:hypothetical protein
MAHYYARRAAYYERVYFKPERQADLRAMEAWLPAALCRPPRAGEWPAAPAGGHRTARRDAAALAGHRPEPRDPGLARPRPMPACVQFATVDAYSLAELAARLSTPPSPAAGGATCRWQRLPGWLDTLHARLQPGAVVVMLDNSFVQTSSTPISARDADGNTYQQRTLDDGRCTRC